VEAVALEPLPALPGLRDRRLGDVDADILVDVRLLPFDQVAALAAAELQHADLRRRRTALTADGDRQRLGASVARDEDRLDPVVEPPQADNGRLGPRLDANLRSGVV